MSWESCGVILPGDLVQPCDAPAGDCRVQAGTADSICIIGVADISAASNTTPPRGSSRTVAYASADMVKVLRGPLTLMLRLAANELIQCGEFLKPAASGEVVAYQCTTDSDCLRIAQSLETLAQDTTGFQWIHVALERFG